MDIGITFELVRITRLAPPVGQVPRPGFMLHFQKAGNAAWWTVMREGNVAPVKVLPAADNRPQVGFGACFTVDAVSLPLI